LQACNHQSKTSRGAILTSKNIALVLIEFQNDFVTPGGTLHEAVKTVMEKNNMLANAVATVKQARALGARILHIPIVFTGNYSELRGEPYGILKGVVDSKSFRKGEWGAQIADSMQPEPQDLVIEGKRGLCAFESTNLDFVLRQLGITEVALAGFLTNCCVESTMRVAYEKGYNVVTLTDCTATLSIEEQEHACAKNFPMFSRPMTHTQWLAEISGEEKSDVKTRGYETT
jgi:ureidoacrylate peracid hydrolase